VVLLCKHCCQKKNETKDKIVIRAITSDNTSPKAQKLAKLGVEIVVGNLDDESSLRKAFQNCWGVFCFTQAGRKGKKFPDQETQDGIVQINAAISAKVSFFVFSSVGSADQHTGIHHFETKYKVEEHLVKNANQFKDGYFIVRPTAFMDNLLTMMRPKDGYLTLPIRPHTRIQWVAVDDIGKIAANSFISPKQYAGKAIDLAGDNLSGSEIVKILSKISGQSVQYSESGAFTKFLIRQFAGDFMSMVDFFEDKGYSADIAEIKQTYVPDLMDFETWASSRFKNATDIGPNKKKTSY